jgi:hypothetical protein
MILTLACKNPELPRFDYVIRQMNARTFDFQVQKNTTTEIIFQETLEAHDTNRGLVLKGKRTELDLSHPEHVTYTYVARSASGDFVNKSYVLNCEITN